MFTRIASPTTNTAGLANGCCCVPWARTAQPPGRTQANVDAAIERLRNSAPGAKADGVAADCASAAGAEKVFARVAEVDILVNNLGIYERKPFFEIADADWLRLFEVNVLSGVRFARRYGQGMARRASERGG